MEESVGVRLDDARVEIRPHGAFFSKYSDVGMEESRRSLGIDPTDTVFLCIGFLGETKAFHRAIEAFRSVGDAGARLYIVGSALYDSETARAYVDRLRALAESVPRVTLVEQFVSDEEFDTWISACSYLVTPYEKAFSSGVIERAKLFEKPVISSEIGGLPQQLSPRDKTFRTDTELAEILRESVKQCETVG